ncbi:NHLP leader peptide domain-containing protein [Desulfotomaculum arcticum]|uniref:NHLP leader peptide domain-containing protein n=1 Tax=Desulfotruncus arcticus DSM 17038 TaxID=1121424 RepID=A0A1I2PDV7_9FIRM|nr:NHLP leader peptide family RiPP precursor [Desulfotruncus arcticus]SFG13673.1 NHLP leader peptide domain-containing protein [Desulfotomaculum arcticum] [Desulfotruncus arcticus DSM 17038]
MSKNENLSKSTPRKEFKQQIILKAQSDKDFKKALVDNPKETLGQLGVQVPEEVEVRVLEESAKVVYLVLPYNPDELTDEQLNTVAGGSCRVIF